MWEKYRVDIVGYRVHQTCCEGFPTGGVVVETPEEYLTAGMGANWEEALKVAWTEMVILISHLYHTTAEYANLIVGTIADARPGYAAGLLNSRGFKNEHAYVTVQLAVTKELKRIS